MCQCLDAFFQWRQNRRRKLFQGSVSNMSPDSMSGCVYKNGLPKVVAMIFSVSIPFVDTLLAPGDFKKIMKKKGATFAQEIRPNTNITYIQKILGNSFSHYIKVHVIHSASRNHTWKVTFYSVIDGVCHYIKKKS